MTIKNYDILSGEDYVSCVVPAFSYGERFNAVNKIACEYVGIEDLTEEEFNYLDAHSDILRQHVEEDFDNIWCGCEEVGWWCADASGEEKIKVYYIDRTLLYLLEDNRMAIDEEEHVNGQHNDIPKQQCLKCWQEKRV